MGMLVNFSAELADWIEHNLARGCGVDALVESMVAQRFEPHIARGLAQAFWHAREEGRAPPQEAISIDALDDQPQPYVYETPRLPSGPVIRTFDRDVPVLMRLARPMLAVLDGVLSADECTQLIALARPRLRPSTVVDPVSGQDTVTDNRDSDGMFFQLRETPFIARLDQRISEIMKCPVEHGEGLQVLRYGPQAKNTPHFDFLVPSHAANRASLDRSGQRISTMVIYLNDVASGGETVFPEIGLAVTPKQGHAVYFEYANSLQQVDVASVHAGAPVHAGEKWAITKWMRERRFVPA